jgi:hypothetical protein
MENLTQGSQVISTFTEDNFHDYSTRRTTRVSVRILRVIRYMLSTVKRLEQTT